MRTWIVAGLLGASTLLGVGRPCFAQSFTEQPLPVEREPAPAEVDVEHIATRLEAIEKYIAILFENAGDSATPGRGPAGVVDAPRALIPVSLGAGLATSGPPKPESETVRAARERLVLAGLEREIQKYQEMRAELWYTNWIGRFIFVVAHLVLGIGLWMSVREFKAAGERRRQAKNVSQQELSISMEGIALKTTLHGTLIMVLALAFYFLYLRFVYPVVVVGGTATGA